MEKRRKYSEEFKREAVGLTRQPGASVSEVGRDIGVGANLLFRWRREFEGKKAFPGSGVEVESEEIGSHRKEGDLNPLRNPRLDCARAKFSRKIENLPGYRF